MVPRDSFHKYYRPFEAYPTRYWPGPCKGFCPENACWRPKQRNGHKAIYGPDSKFLAIRRRYENENDTQFDSFFCCLASFGATASCAGSFQVSALYTWNELDQSAGAYRPKDGRCEVDSWPSNAGSGSKLVAAKPSRGFVPIGYRCTDSYLFLQRRALQDVCDLRPNLHGRAHRGGHGDVHFGEIRPGDKC